MVKARVKSTEEIVQFLAYNGFTCEIFGFFSRGPIVYNGGIFHSCGKEIDVEKVDEDHYKCSEGIYKNLRYHEEFLEIEGSDDKNIFR